MAVMNDFYRNVLATGSLVADEMGLISAVNLKGDLVEITAGRERKRIALPMQHNLQNPEAYAIFHPLQENVLEGPSPMMKMLIDKYVLSINMKLHWMISALVDFIADTEP